MKHYYILDQNNRLTNEIIIDEEESIDEKIEEGQSYTMVSIPENFDARYFYFDNGEWKEDVEKHLSNLKNVSYQQLWHNYKIKQNKFLDAEDLILATTLAGLGNEKGIAVRNWVMNLWRKYYVVKDAIKNSSTLDEIKAIDLNENFSDCPYTVRELNDELMVISNQ